MKKLCTGHLIFVNWSGDPVEHFYSVTNNPSNSYRHYV